MISEEIPQHHFPQCVGMHTGDNGAAAWEAFFAMCRELATMARKREAIRLQAEANREPLQGIAQEGQR